MLKFFGLLQTQKSTTLCLKFFTSQRSTLLPACLYQKKDMALLENSQNSQFSVSLTINVMFLTLLLRIHHFLLLVL